MQRLSGSASKLAFPSTADPRPRSAAEMKRYLLSAFVLPMVMLACQPTAPQKLELFVGGYLSGPNFYVVLSDDGAVTIRSTRLPIVPPGKLTESSEVLKITHDEAKALLRLADQASDFSEECDVVADGTMARLTLTRGTKKSERACNNASVWPKGQKTRQFLERLNKNLPERWQVS
jgi:hypothetical protein